MVKGQLSFYFQSHVSTQGHMVYLFSICEGKSDGNKYYQFEKKWQFHQIITKNPIISDVFFKKLEIYFL